MIKLRLSERLGSHHRATWVAAAVGGVLLVAFVAAGSAFAYYSGRILPGVSIAGVQVGGLTPKEALAKLEVAKERYQTTFVVGTQEIQPKPEELGVTVQTAESVAEAFVLGHHGAVWEWAGDWWRLTDGGVRHREVSYRFDEGKLDAYVAKVVQTTSKAPVNAKLSVDGEAVEIVPEVAGQQTGVADAAAKVRASLKAFGSVRLEVGMKTLDPAIHAAELSDAKVQAEQMIAVPVTLTYQSVTYAPTKAQRAAWLAFSEDAAAKTDRVSVDQTALGRYLAGAVTNKIAYPAMPKIIQKNVDTGETSVAQEGRDGLAVDQNGLVRTIAAAVAAGRAFSSPVPTSVVAFATQERKIYDRWIDVSLTDQRLTAYERGAVVKSFLISSGTRYHPTVQGTYYIYGKTRSQTMSGGSRLAGDYYSLPNVEWISWWYGDYSIHGTYWHHNFGHPMSHGCLNATNDDAHFIYDWAPVGTPVVVHT